MKRLAGCLVVSLVASAAVWVGCRDDLGDETLPLLVIDDAAVLGVGSADGGMPDAGSGSGTGIDAPGVPDAGSDSGTVVDAPGVPDAGSGEGGPPDAGSDAGLGGDAYGGGGGTDDGGTTTTDGGGRPDARRGPEIDPVDRTSFYACAGGPGSAGVEVGLPIGLALAIAVRRRRRWRQAGSPDRAP